MNTRREELTMNIRVQLATFVVGIALIGGTAHAGPIDPDCTAEKAAKSAAAKSTVGVGGRCSAGEAAKDTGKNAAGIQEKGPIDKATGKNDGPAAKAKDAVKK
jgi:hypothetical protein